MTPRRPRTPQRNLRRPGLDPDRNRL